MLTYIAFANFFSCCRGEIGTYYALDLGSVNIRMVQVQLGGRRSSIISKDVEIQPIPEHLMTSTSEVTMFCTAYAL